MSSIVLPEIIAAGVYSADVPQKGREVTKNRRTTMFELELALRDGGVSYLDGESTAVTEGMMICIGPGRMRHTRLPFKCAYVHITAEGALRDILSGLPPFFKPAHPEYYAALLERISAGFHIGTEQELLCAHSALLELIYSLGRESVQSADVHSLATVQGPVDRALEFIRENPAEDLSLGALSRLVSLSPVHFHNCFRSATGRTLRDYVEEVRIKRAVALLVSTDYTLTKIAFECGFSSQSYFSYAFRRRMGRTPREYARELQSRYEE